MPGIREGLEGDVKGWIGSSGSCVDLAITICIDVLRPQQQMGTMTIAKWEPCSNDATNRDANRTAMRTTVLTIRTQASTVAGTAIGPQSGNYVPCDELCVFFEIIFSKSTSGSGEGCFF